MTSSPDSRPAVLPALSVIVPARNDPGNLERCLAALDESHYRAFEVIVVDDASTDETPNVAHRHGARVLRLESRSGPAAARNRGAEAAEHDYLFFLDADVLVRPETVGQVAARFVEFPDIVAFFGSYDAAPGAPNLVSQYRNLLHHYVHQIGNEEASTFWSGCGAIKKSVFLEVGGFDAGYDRASIEDIELGARLRQAGHRIALVKRIQVKHLKRWTLVSMVDCDVRKRGIPWTRLLLRQGKLPNDLNLRYTERLSAALAGGLVVTLGLGLLDQERRTVWLLMAASLLLGFLSLNYPFYRLISSVRSPLFAALSLPLHVLYYLCSATAFAIGAAQHLGQRLWRPLAEPE